MLKKTNKLKFFFDILLSNISKMLSNISKKLKEEKKSEDFKNKTDSKNVSLENSKNISLGGTFIANNITNNYYNNHYNCPPTSLSNKDQKILNKHHMKNEELEKEPTIITENKKK